MSLTHLSVLGKKTSDKMEIFINHLYRFQINSPSSTIARYFNVAMVTALCYKYRPRFVICLITSDDFFSLIFFSHLKYIRTAVSLTHYQNWGQKEFSKR